MDQLFAFSIPPPLCGGGGGVVLCEAPLLARCSSANNRESCLVWRAKDSDFGQEYTRNEALTKS